LFFLFEEVASFGKQAVYRGALLIWAWWPVSNIKIYIGHT